jgi:hypothetical protein
MLLVHLAMVLLLRTYVLLNELVALYFLIVSLNVAAYVAPNTVSSTRSTDANRVAHTQTVDSLNTIATFARDNLLSLKLTNRDAREIATHRLFHLYRLMNNVAIRVILLHS